MSQPKATLKTLARELGVSPATVSLVLQGRGDSLRIAEGTQDRIRRHAEERRYRGSWTARALRAKRTGTIGVVFPDVQEAFMNRILKGIEEAAYPEGFRLMISTSYFETAVEAANIEALLDREMDGLLIVPYVPFRGEPVSYDHLADAVEQVPTVAIDRYIPGVVERAVVGDDAAAVEGAVDLLAGRGCRSLGYVGFDLPITTLEARHAAFHRAARARDLRVNGEVLLRERNENSRDLSEALRALHRSGEMPDGFLVSTNGLSYRVMEVLGHIGADGVQLAKFGEDPQWARTGMIQIRQPHEELGRRAMHLLSAGISGKAPGASDSTERDNRSRDTAAKGSSKNIITIPSEVVI